MYRDNKDTILAANVLIQINGIYELDYNNYNADANAKIKHSYIFMNGQDLPQAGVTQKVRHTYKNVKIEHIQNLRHNRIEQNAEGKWELKVSL